MNKVLEPLNALKSRRWVSFVVAKREEGALEQIEPALCQEPGCIRFIAAHAPNNSLHPFVYDKHSRPLPFWSCHKDIRSSRRKKNHI